jgi:malonate transporter MadL subunit
MAVYGTALLAICLLVGNLLGTLLGQAMGIDANVGGVGIAMLLLILITDRLRSAGTLTAPTQAGVVYWSSIYIPIVVAMAATQNVPAAVNAGSVALLAGGIAVVASFALVPLLSRLGPKEPPTPPATHTASVGDKP